MASIHKSEFWLLSNVGLSRPPGHAYESATDSISIFLGPGNDHRKTCIKGLSREVRLTLLQPPPPSVAVFLCINFIIPAKILLSPIKPLTKLLDHRVLHVTLSGLAIRP